MSLSSFFCFFFLHIFNFVDFLSSFIKLFVVVVILLLFSFPSEVFSFLTGCLPYWGLQVFDF